MYAGRVVEDLPTADLTSVPRHPYTRALLAATLELDTDRDEPLAVIPGRPPEPDQVPEGARSPPAARWRRTGAGARTRSWSGSTGHTGSPAGTRTAPSRRSPTGKPPTEVPNERAGV